MLNGMHTTEDNDLTSLRFYEQPTDLQLGEPHEEELPELFLCRPNANNLNSSWDHNGNDCVMYMGWYLQFLFFNVPQVLEG